MEQQSTESNELVWAIVHSSSLRLIARIPPNTHVGNQVVIKACELRITTAVLPTPNGPVSAHIAHIVDVTPVDTSREAFSTIEVVVNGLRWFTEMDEKERKNYENMIDGMQQGLQAQRLAELGITAPVQGGSRIVSR